MQTWSFRDEILRMTRQWYIVLAFIIVAGLLGYGGTYIFPAPYRATADLYIGIDVIRVGEMDHVIPLSKHEPLNLDDYKNWQLKQVADLISSEKVLTQTLSALQEQDEYWKQTEVTDLKAFTNIYWYDAGVWRLEVVHPQAKYAAQAVEAWREAGYSRTEALLVHAERATALDAELQSSNTSLGIVEKRIAALETFLTRVEEWETKLTDITDSEDIDTTTRAALQAWIEQSEVAWDALREALPAPESGREAYLAWLETAQEGAATALEDAQAEHALLSQSREEILIDYHAAQDDSYGLSANLYLEPSFEAVQRERVRSTGTVTLLAGGIGLLAWVFVVFLQTRNQEDGDVH